MTTTTFNSYFVKEFPNTINTVILQFRTPVGKPDSVDYYLITQEPTGANRRETKFDTRQVINFNPYVRWIDSRYFIVSTGSRFGPEPTECRSRDINWSPDLVIQHDVYRMPEDGYFGGGSQPCVPEHLKSIPDLYPGYADDTYTHNPALGYEIIPPSPDKYRRSRFGPPSDGEGASTADKPKVLDPSFCRIHSYWINTTDTPFSRKLQDELHATYSIRDDPRSESCKVYKFTPENPENPDYKDQEAVDAANAGKVPSRIQDYLTPKSRPYHEAMTAVLGNMLASAKLHGFVFGGYILGLIEHHTAYQVNPEGTEYRLPNDVDVWFSRSETPTGKGCYSRNGLEWYVLKNISAYLVASGRKYQHVHDKVNDHTTRYGVAKLLIDETYRFDLVCNINNSCKFDSLSDFSATNLYYKVGGTGELNLRTACGGFTLEQVLGHIRTRELRPIIEFPRLFKFVGDQHEYDWYQTKFQTREQKMRDRGYSYPEGVVPLTEQYIPAMADCLAEIRALETARTV